MRPASAGGSSLCRGAASRPAPMASASRWWRRARICRPPASACCGGCAARSEELGWRSAVHELRSVTQAIWGAASLDERRRFLRHLRPWWDVHRHKIAPAIGATDRGDAGRGAARRRRRANWSRPRPSRTARASRFRMRGTEAVETLRVARIVNCTGPETRHRPRRRAVARRVARSRADPAGRARHRHRGGRRVPGDRRGRRARATRLSVIGPVTRGTFWESVAVPDIRAQAERVAARLRPPSPAKSWDSRCCSKSVTPTLRWVTPLSDHDPEQGAAALRGRRR